MRTEKHVNAENLARALSLKVQQAIAKMLAVNDDGTSYRCLLPECKNKGDQPGGENILSSDNIYKHLMSQSHSRAVFKDEVLKVMHPPPAEAATAPPPPSDAMALVMQRGRPPGPGRPLQARETTKPVNERQVHVDVRFVGLAYGDLGTALHRASGSEQLRAACALLFGNGETGVSPLSTLYRDAVPRARNAEILLIRKEIDGAFVSVACDGASFLGEARFGIIIRFVCPRTKQLKARSLTVASGGGKSAAALAAIIVAALRQFDLLPEQVVSLSGDAENKNLALFKALEAIGVGARQPCLSHLLSTAGKLVICPPLDRLRAAFTAATSNSYHARDLLHAAFRAVYPGAPEPTIHAFSDTRFYSLYVFLVETLLPYLAALERLARGRRHHPASEGRRARTTFARLTDDKPIEHTATVTALLEAYLADRDTLPRVLQEYKILLAPLVNACFALESSYIGPLTGTVLSSLTAYIRAKDNYVPDADLDASPAFAYVSEHLVVDADSLDNTDFADATVRAQSYMMSHLLWERLRFLDPLFLESELKQLLQRRTDVATARRSVAQNHIIAFGDHPWFPRIAPHLQTEPDLQLASDEICRLLASLQQPDDSGTLAKLRESTLEHARSVHLRSSFAKRAEALFDWWHARGRAELFPRLHALYRTVVAMMPSNCEMERTISKWRDLVTPQQSSSSHELFETMVVLFTNTQTRKHEKEHALRNTFVDVSRRKRKAAPIARPTKKHIANDGVAGSPIHRHRTARSSNDDSGAERDAGSCSDHGHHAFEELSDTTHHTARDAAPADDSDDDSVLGDESDDDSSAVSDAVGDASSALDDDVGDDSSALDDVSGDDSSTLGDEHALASGDTAPDGTPSANSSAPDNQHNVIDADTARIFANSTRTFSRFITTGRPAAHSSSDSYSDAHASSAERAERIRAAQKRASRRK
eukprot:a339284_112.p1 GENE.a339284_112~~a339284_112.p1  ORF type:complete len:1066 (-),score=228.71 a339284_112:23-2830(-)